MERYVFLPYGVTTDDIKGFSEALYSDSFRVSNYEGVMYSIYFSLRYGFEIDNIDCDKLIETDDCLCLLFAWLYYKDKGGAELIALEQEAKSLSSTALDRNWLFCYEVLNASDLPEGDWRALKNAGVSFLAEIQSDEVQVSNTVAVTQET